MTGGHSTQGVILPSDNGTTVRSLKAKHTTGELRRRLDSSTIVLRCENRHVILTSTVYIYIYMCTKKL